MKKRLLQIFVIVLVIIGIAVSVGSVKLEGWDSFKFGKLTFDLGGVTGCKGEGAQCIILY